MNAAATDPGATQRRALHRLFLTLFLRGRGARGLQKTGVPASLPRKLAFTLLVYVLFGCVGLSFAAQGTFGLALGLHSMAFLLVGMFVAMSAGEVLFNASEADILLHRPVTPRALLRAKVSVILQVSLWLAGAFNLAGMIAGAARPDGTWLFVPAHCLATVLEALFCIGSVVLAYQLALRWLPREKLDSLMTTAQVVVSVSVVFAGQILPRVAMRLRVPDGLDAGSWWLALLPPAWFAGIDDALAGSHRAGSWILASVAVAATAGVLWAGFVRLAGEYETGLRAMVQAPPSPVPAGGTTRPRILARLAGDPPLSWWLRDPVSRAAFVLAGAYLARDRDVKLRVYPGIAPVLILPVIFLVQSRGPGGDGAGFMLFFAGAYAAMVPMMALEMLRYSQHWLAADLFRVAPLAGPARLHRGVRAAVLCFLTAPMLALLACVMAWMGGVDALVALLPGALLVPVMAVLPGLSGAAPFSQPGEAAKSAGRGVTMFAAMMAALALSGAAAFARHQGWLPWMLAAEAVLALGAWALLRHLGARVRWKSAE